MREIRVDLHGYNAIAAAKTALHRLLPVLSVLVVLACYNARGRICFTRGTKSADFIPPLLPLLLWSPDTVPPFQPPVYGTRSHVSSLCSMGHCQQTPSHFSSLRSNSSQVLLYSLRIKTWVTHMNNKTKQKIDMYAQNIHSLNNYSHSHSKVGLQTTNII